MQTLDTVLRYATQLIFALVALLALADYVRRPSRWRLDAALMLLSLALAIGVGWVSAASGYRGRWLSTAGAFSVLAHPYLLLRLVGHVRATGRLIRWIGAGGLIASWGVLLVATPPLPPAATLAIVAYFILIEGCAGAGLVWAARAHARTRLMDPATTGATASGASDRRQLGLAAAGSALLALVIGLAGVNVAIPAAAVVLTPLSSVLSILAALGYYFGFAPPGWIRDNWRTLRLGGQVVPLVGAATLLTALGTAGAVVWQLDQALADVSTLRVWGPVALLIFTSAGGSALLAARLFRPLRQLSAAAARFGAGDYQTRVHVTGAADLRSLAEQFNQMAEAVGAHAAELGERRAHAEQRAAERQALLDLTDSIGAETDGRVRRLPDRGAS